ncbi:hypothetical protein FACS1894172_07080 [Spirochaetia bacterium]|nr:hypothetical protein FACS1894172_07080 [Spirochaetia bacterium]
MRISLWPAFTAAEPEAFALSIGVFDGVHRGHQILIEKIVKKGPNPTILTFRENPKKVLRPETFSGDIYSLNRKLSLFEQLGVEETVLIDFSGDFATMEGETFIRILCTRGLSYLVVGNDFRCGHARDTGVKEIKKQCIESGAVIEVVAPVYVGTEPVTSSRIRNTIRTGNLEEASLLLGRTYP